MKLKFIIGLLIILLATCSSKQPPPDDSGVEGQVFIGPLCPVIQQGQPCPDRPYQATITINNIDGKKVTRVQTDEQGHFKVFLAPGNYILHPESPNVMPHAEEQSFTVEAAKFTEVTVNYDSGIR